MAAAAAAATTSAPSQGGGLTMNGPIALILLFFKYAIPIAAFVVTVDGLRRPASDFPKPFWRWVWVVPQALLLVVTVAGYVGGPRLTAPIAGWILLLAFVCLVMQVGYLLEVVFPKRPHGGEPPEAGAGVREPRMPMPVAPGGHAEEPTDRE